MKWSYRAGGLVAAVLTAGLLLFQNCSQPQAPFDAGGTFASSLAFSFDTQMDTLGYMSCASSTAYSSPSIWTFKLSAQGLNSGVRLTPAFFSAAASFSDSEKATLLNQSPENMGALAQVALRDFDNLQTPISRGAVTPSEGVDFVSLLTNLDSSLVAPNLVAAHGAPISYFPALGTAGRIEATLRYTDSEGLAQVLRNNLAAKTRLTVTYKSSNGGQAYYARGLGGEISNTRAYGNSYLLNFSYFPSDSSGPRILASVQESNLLNQSFLANWVCGSEMRFRIGRSTSDCPATLDSDPTNASNPARLAMIRRVLSVSDWYVNLGASCVLQKSVSLCYATGETGNHYVSLCNRNL